MLWRRSLDAVLLLPAGSPEPLTLAGTGADLWDLLATPASTTELVAELAGRYAADPAVVAADLTPVLAELETLGAIEPHR